MNLQAQIREKVDEIDAIWTNADNEGRPASRRERARIEALLAEAKDLKGRLKVDEEAREVSEWIGAPDASGPGDPNVRFGGEQAGDAFVKSAGYRQIRDSAARPSQWSSGPVESKQPCSRAHSTVRPTARRSFSPTSDPASSRSCSNR